MKFEIVPTVKCGDIIFLTDVQMYGYYLVNIIHFKKKRISRTRQMILDSVMLITIHMTNL